MTDPAIEVVHIGSASRDITDDDPRGWRLGGGVTYSALTTARLGLRTAAVVGLDPLVANASELEQLREASVELLLVGLAESPAFRNEETPAGRIQTCVAPGLRLPVVDLPSAWAAAPAWSLVPVAGEVGDDWAAAVPPGGYLAVGWQGLLRELAAGKIVTRCPPEASALIRRADLVGVSLHDLEPGTALADLGRLLHRGADLVVTDGQRGGRLLRADRDGSRAIVQYEAREADREDDPTGAGDTFLGALLASIVRPTIVPGGQLRRGLKLDPDVDLVFAAAAASLVIERPGLLGVADLAAVQERYSKPRGGRGVSGVS
jgi:sugar/nucleoside kinase (ribokinase family)